MNGQEKYMTFDYMVVGRWSILGVSCGRTYVPDLDIRFWVPSRDRIAAVRGLLPDAFRLGDGQLYTQDGWVLDAAHARALVRIVEAGASTDEAEREAMVVFEKAARENGQLA
jgi:hypothetical protein